MSKIKDLQVNAPSEGIDLFGEIAELFADSYAEEAVAESFQLITNAFHTKGMAFYVIEYGANLEKNTFSCKYMYAVQPSVFPRECKQDFFRETVRKGSETGRGEEFITLAFQSGAYLQLMVVVALSDAMDQSESLLLRFLKSYLPMLKSYLERLDDQEKIDCLAQFPDANPHPVIRTERSGRVIYSNSSGSEILVQMPGHSFLQVPSEWIDQIERVLSSQSTLVWESSVANKRLSLAFCPLDENIVNVYGLNETEFFQSQAELNKLRTAIQQLQETIVITDLKGCIEYVNPAFEKLTGYSLEEAKGQHTRILNAGKQSQEFYETMWKTILAGKTWSGDFVNVKKNGDLFEEEASISPIFDNQGELVNFVAVKKNVTELRKMELRLRQDQKMKAIGSLAAGIAHELNTPLGFIGSNFELLCDYLETLCSYLKTMKLDASIRDEFEFILQEAPLIRSESQAGFQRIQSIVQSLRNFSCVDSINHRQVYDLNKSVSDTLLVLDGQLKNLAAIDLSLGKIPPVYCNPEEIHLVLMHLILNALQAIESLGLNGLSCIHISTSLKEELIALVIQDEGPGIPEKLLEQITDPFFSTKPVGSALGLGLHTCYDIIVNKHQGKFDISSFAGHGTKVEIGIPIQNII